MFDTHAHYNNPRFDEEFPGGWQGAVENAFDAGVTGIINVGWDIPSSRLASEQALRYRGRLFAAVGIHPCDAQKLPRLDRALSELEELLRDRERLAIVALGEIGFDYHYEDTDRVLQRIVFDRQLSLAERYRLPVLIHDREAHADTLSVLREHPAARCLLHSFSGSAETAREAVRLGCYLSFSGTVSFKNAPKVREAARVVPEDRILIETDCPYLAPHPHRGELNRSSLMRFTLEALANARGISAEEAERITTRNALRFFGLSS